MKAATAVASSGSSRMESSRAVADESRMDVEGEERDTEHKAKNYDENIMGKAANAMRERWQRTPKSRQMGSVRRQGKPSSLDLLWAQ